MILSGVQSGAFLQQRLIEKISSLKIVPNLAIVQIGNNEASNVYINKKIQKAKELGFIANLYKFNEDISFEDLKTFVINLNENSEIHGIIIQLPIPIHLKKIIHVVSLKKDIDGLNFASQGALLNHENCFIPCTPKAVMSLLNYYNLSVNGKKALIIGRSNLVGVPLSYLLLNKDATVTIAHSKTQNLEFEIKNADFVFSAVGVADFIKPDWVSENNTIIDIGISLKNGKICGDLSKEAAKIVKNYSCVPNGVGVLTVISLMENLVESAFLAEK